MYRIDAERIKKYILLTYVLMAAAGIFLAVVIAHAVTCSTCEKDGAECVRISAVTYADRFRSKGEYDYVHEFTDLKEGDILITDSVHTFGWRHGHVAIVTDADENTVLEAVTFGIPAKERNLRKWKSYSSVIHARITDDAAEEALYEMGIGLSGTCTPSEQLGALAASYASANIRDIKYGFFPGIRDKAPEPDELTKTHCAHLVWYIYSNFGVDLDSNGGFIVTPKDLYKSEKLRIVEKFGFSTF